MNPKPRILIVDDTEHARRINGAVLSREGYELEFASDGAEALEKVAAFQPDVILSDVVMPGMDGLEMCRAIKKNPLQRHIPVILLSSLDRKEDIVHGLDEGADEFLPKPANPRELCARVRTMLRIKKQHDELQAALKLRDDLAHMIVHDMRSPLGTIIGSAELLAIDTLPKEKSTAAIQRITKQARRLNSLADDLLIVSKIEHGRMLLNRKTFSITDALAKAVDSHGILADATAHRLEFSNAADIPPISGDPDLILRVFDNLVSNALKYSPPGTTITIRAEHDLAIGQVHMHFADEGPGIPENQRTLVFEKYGTLQNAREDVRQVGLGLYFCKLAVESHGGSIDVQPNEPRGSIFTVRLPIASAVDGASAEM